MTGEANPSAAPVLAQRDHWNAIAPAWAAWWPMIEQGAAPVTDTLLAFAALEPGNRVLDLASGIGEPAASAARRIGPGGQVVATDLSPVMVAQGRARVRDLGLANIAFRVMDAAEPDLPDGGFDAVLCRWGLMFVPDPAATMKRLYALLKSGGRLAVAVWGPPEEVPSISLGTKILTEQLDLPPPGEDDRSPFELSDIEAFEETLAVAGFTGLTRAALSVVYDFPSAETFIAFRKAVSQIERRITHIPAKRREAAWQAVAAALAPYRRADGRIVMANLAICVAAHRP